jgi:hypothetical protein
MASKDHSGFLMTPAQHLAQAELLERSDWSEARELARQHRLLAWAIQQRQRAAAREVET